MNIFFDTNVLLDIALRREPHFAPSEALFTDAIKHHVCYLSWHTISNLSYILGRCESPQVALEFVEQITNICRIAPVEHSDFSVALDYNNGDLEDAMQIACALAVNAQTIVSRDASGFAKSPIPVTNPSYTT